MQKIAISGASGFIGSHVRKKFENNVIINKDDTKEEILAKLKGVDVVINLAGAPIVQKWDEEYKKVLFSSRIESTKKLVDAINKSEVKQFISASAVGIYPDNKACDESCEEVSNDFLGILAFNWENEAKKCEKTTTILRLGVVLGANGGAFSTMLSPFKLGLGGIIGNGQMMTSWIDIDDLIRIYGHVIEKKLNGVYNAVSPSPITNFAFTKALGKVLNRPTIFPLPNIIVKMLFGEGAIVLTGSKEIYPKALVDTGFSFKYEDVKSSFLHLLKEK